MKSVTRALLVFVLAVVGALFLGRTAAPDLFLYRTITDYELRWISTLVEVPMLAAGAAFAFRSGRDFGVGNPAGRGWRLIGAWMALLAAGQFGYSFHPLILRTVTPLPWWGDGLYLAGYVAMIAGVLSFQRTYAASGFAVGVTNRSLTVLVAGAVAIAEIFLLTPIVRLDTPWIQRAVNIVFPILDGVAFVSLFVLATTLRALRGGRLWRIWFKLLLALALASLGDILFAYFFFHELERLEAVVNLAFMASYLLAATAAYDQLVALRSEVRISTPSE